MFQEGVSAAQKAQLEERQQEEEKVKSKLAALSAKLQQLGKETVALVCVAAWWVVGVMCVCAGSSEGSQFKNMSPGQGEVDTQSTQALAIPPLEQVSELSTRTALSTKESQLREQKKTVTGLQQQLADFAAAYKLIKTERNHTHSQINKLQQVVQCDLYILLTVFLSSWPTK